MERILEISDEIAMKKIGRIFEEISGVIYEKSMEDVLQSFETFQKKSLEEFLLESLGGFLKKFMKEFKKPSMQYFLK